MQIFLYLFYFIRSVILRGFFNTGRLLLAEKKNEKYFGISTSAIKKSDSDEYFHYQGAGYLVLLRLYKDIFIQTGHIDFVDIGCGKGRAVFVAEYCGYNNLTGIELNPQLVRSAEKNLRVYPFKRPASQICFIHQNALEYEFENKPTVYFLFNPFNEKILDKVLEKITGATRSETWFIYMNPLYQGSFARNKIKKVKEYKTRFYTEAVLYRLDALV